MRPRPKDLAGSCACSPFDAIIARIEALERRATAIVSAVEGIAPDATGNVNLPNSSEIGDALYGRMDAFTMSSVAKTIDDKLEELLLRIGAFDFAGADTRIQEATDAVEQVEAELTGYEARITALEEDIISINAHIQAVENDYVEKVGSTMTGPLHIPTNATGTRDDVAVNGKRVQADLDAYAHMMRIANNQNITGRKVFVNKPIYERRALSTFAALNLSGWLRVCRYRINPDYNDMHMMVNFISGHTTDLNFNFGVDIMQRTHSTDRMVLIYNASTTIPLAITKQASGNEVGLVSLTNTYEDVDYVEIWGWFPTNRLIIEVTYFSLISHLPTPSDGTVFEGDSVGVSGATTNYVTWDLQTFADTPTGTSLGYIKKGVESL